MTAEGTIEYEALAQEAMRGVVRTVLTRAAKTGLPGEHHFYISFNTLAPGVILSKRLREKYAEEMTIVLQHRFWDLIVTAERFEVKLTFDGIPERLVVPYKSIKVFFDPSVRYGLQFDTAGDIMESLGAADTPRHQRDTTAPPISLAPGPVFPRPATPAETSPDRILAEINAETEVARARKTGSEQSKNIADEPASTDEDNDAGPPGAEIVSLDSFRKK
ncbi:MAG TPA: ClpXP protease specificity-enhancing factor SspB [Hyphomicrobiaceae bacterium]|nr:ClpXP protease specificity-enhancing factor SspB [Hyphomicrobiaceae bacterium]